MYENDCGYCELRELDKSGDLFFAVNDLIEKEIAKRVAQEIGDVEAVRQSKNADEITIMKLKSEIGELKQRVWQIERKAESDVLAAKKACAEEIARTQADALRSLFGDIKPGMKVFRLEDCRVGTKCKSCDGKGSFDAEINGVKVSAKCKECGGDGKRRLDGKRVDRKYVNAIIASMESADGAITVRVGSGCMDHGRWPIKGLILDKDEAQRQADEYNAKMIKRYREGK